MIKNGCFLILSASILASVGCGSRPVEVAPEPETNPKADASCAESRPSAKDDLLGRVANVRLRFSQLGQTGAGTNKSAQERAADALVALLTLGEERERIYGDIEANEKQLADEFHKFHIHFFDLVDDE